MMASLLPLGTPTCIGRASGHFWFPALHVLGDQLLCLVPRVPDEGHGHWRSSLFLSNREAREWREVGELTLGWASLALEPNRLLLLPFNLWTLSLEHRRTARGTAWWVAVSPGGEIHQEPHEVLFSNLPWDFQIRDGRRLALTTSGDRVLQLPDGSWFTTLYGLPEGSERYANLAVVSHDGYHWWFCSLIADPEHLPEGAQGPCESATALLADSRLLCVYRVGNGQDYFRSLSPDLGHSWGAPVRLPGLGSVKPQLLALEDGSLLLAGGRPGLHLWRSEDGETWDSFDLQRTHDALVDTGDQIPADLPATAETEAIPGSTGYLSLQVLGEREILVAYDRLAHGWKGAPGPYGETDAVFCLRLRVD